MLAQDSPCLIRNILWAFLKFQDPVMTVLSFVLSYQCWMWKGGCLLQSPTSHGVAPRKIEYYLPPPSARLLWWRCLLKTALQRSVTQAGERSGWVCWRQILRGMSTLRRLWRALRWISLLPLRAPLCSQWLIHLPSMPSSSRPLKVLQVEVLVETQWSRGWGCLRRALLTLQRV